MNFIFQKGAELRAHSLEVLGSSGKWRSENYSARSAGVASGQSV